MIIDSDGVPTCDMLSRISLFAQNGICMIVILDKEVLFSAYSWKSALAEFISKEITD